MLREIVVCSLEAWDEIWRRNQFFADALLRRNPELRILFIEPPTDPLHALQSKTMPKLPRFSSIRSDRRLHAFRPIKPLPRRAGSFSDRALQRQVIFALRSLHYKRPVLWLNDPTYAPLITKLRAPAVYDITDDWLLAPFTFRELNRLRSLEDEIFEQADEIVVCSPDLLRSRGSRRSVTLVGNGVDADHFRRMQKRPHDLPSSPVAVYVGSLHDSRIDVDLVLELARTVPNLAVALVGPNSLETSSRARLANAPGIHLLGPRAYRDVPGYLQHADVVIVPHRVSPFTESLDPIKAYECIAVGTPTVATPVAGFRELAGILSVVPPASFIDAVIAALRAPRRDAGAIESVSWEERARAFEEVLVRAEQANKSSSNPARQKR